MWFLLSKQKPHTKNSAAGPTIPQDSIAHTWGLIHPVSKNCINALLASSTKLFQELSKCALKSIYCIKIMQPRRKTLGINSGGTVKQNMFNNKIKITMSIAI